MVYLVSFLYVKTCLIIGVKKLLGNLNVLLIVLKYILKVLGMYLKLSAQPYGQPNAKYVHFFACTRYLMCT